MVNGKDTLQHSRRIAGDVECGLWNAAWK